MAVPLFPEGLPGILMFEKTVPVDPAVSDVDPPVEAHHWS
jgi:hypothetical protein